MTASGGMTLGETLAKVRSRIGPLRERTERIGEQYTKAILIDPVLAALGWDLGNLDEVSREYRHKPQDNPVDYALRAFGQPLLFIEAKALGTDLSPCRYAAQVLAYASIVGVAWCLLTDGDEYRLYNAHAPVDVDEKLFHTVRVSDADQAESCRETLELLSKERMGGLIPCGRASSSTVACVWPWMTSSRMSTPRSSNSSARRHLNSHLRRYGSHSDA